MHLCTRCFLGPVQMRKEDAFQKRLVAWLAWRAIISGYSDTYRSKVAKIIDRKDSGVSQNEEGACVRERTEWIKVMAAKKV